MKRLAKLQIVAIICNKYLLYSFPCLVTKGPYDQQLQSVIHEPVLKTLRDEDESLNPIPMRIRHYQLNISILSVVSS